MCRLLAACALQRQPVLLHAPYHLVGGSGLRQGGCTVAVMFVFLAWQLSGNVQSHCCSSPSDSFLLVSPARSRVCCMSCWLRSGVCFGLVCASLGMFAAIMFVSWHFLCTVLLSANFCRRLFLLGQLSRDMLKSW